ncbi:hypothetical protein EUGRSUZ_C03618 [Eucalyptus grandis]|uniref:Uncharacterized protein n=1 Tax=Eucalyptus grandis TaxID=71139 RepID=A0ACC3LIY7_EUCGR|nr:hypothetical protein EUGRSUZ_C03618 [Eucalyptus grandis]
MPSITSPRRRSPSPPSHQQASSALKRSHRERRLYEASLGGCLESLAQLLQEDGLILARALVTCFDETPLHVACMQGNVHFAKLLLAHKRDLAMELDLQGRTPLHWASANGYIEIARELLQSDPLACLVHDEDGWTPLHLAMMKGRSNIVIELVKARPEAAEHRLSHGQTALHLGVSHNRLEALKVLVEIVRDGDLVKAQDDEGNTILHLAIANKQIEPWLTKPALGGVWDNDQKDKNNGAILHYAGTPMMAANDPKGYPMFWTYNTISFLASLSTIFLLISGFPLGKKVLMWILMATMWVTIIFTALTYLRSMLAFLNVQREFEDTWPTKAASPPTQATTQSPIPAAEVFMYVWLCAVAILFLVHIVRYLVIVLRKIRKSSRSGYQDV